MKSLLIKIRVGAILAPALIVIIYFLFGCLDLITTYLASPDLKHENNWVYRTFNLNWPLLIAYTIFLYIVMTFLLLISLQYLKNCFEEHKFSSFNKILIHSKKNIKLLITVVIIGIFYSHLISIGLVIVNNFLSYVYLQSNKENWLKNISVFYVNRQKYFLFFIQYIVVIPGYILAFMKVNKIRLRTIGKPHVD
ncbi:MAG TPA: hypothetical protein P5320_11050 [Bacteroidales bacterium]|nr:hypothetical protein [Bacteroidales bacterium]HRR17252.1 hypothetical protein [Bacteroidales bacterium]HRT48704.1 hypothetical protein [Bacteroidales bacterium]